MMILKELPNSIDFLKVFIKNDADAPAAADDNNCKYFALVRDPILST